MRAGLALPLLLLLGLALGGQPAHAQWVLNNTAASVGDTAACTGTQVVRSFEVGRGGSITDVDLGMDANHSWRGDIRARLTSPQGTTVEVLTADTDTSGNYDNYRIRLDDGAAVAVNTGSHAVNTSTAAGRYADRVRPSNPLSAFNGQNPQGTWTLSLCDAFPDQDNGVFLRATLFVEVAAPPEPPQLACTVGAPTPFVWAAPGQTNGWAAGSLINGYSTTDDIPLAFAVTGDTGDLVPRNGLATPHTDTEFHPQSQRYSLLINQDPPSRANSVTLALNVGTPGAGVEAMRFIMEDVDKDSWVDRVRVRGSLGGVAVAPVITPGAANRVDGNTVRGTSRTPSGTPQSEVTVTFTQAVDRVELRYDNAPDATANPPAHVIGFFGDLALCPLPRTDLSAVKSVEVANPQGTGRFMIPGNTVLYKITVTHTPASNQDATNVDISDALPPTLAFVSAASSGFTAGTFNNANCPGAGCTVVFEDGVLPPNATGEIQVTALIR